MKVSCPTCKQTTEYDEKNPFRPFCSERCKVIDLGDWASEKFAIPVDHSENDDIEAREEIPTDED